MMCTKTIKTCSETVHAAESNSVLKLKFQKLHTTVVDSVNAAKVIDFLFQEGVVGASDMDNLQLLMNNPKQQCRVLLTQLHKTEHPQAFVQLYLAIKAESHLRWLVERIDNYTDQSLISLLEKLYVSEPKGNCSFCLNH